jgi:hypothetical protein
MLRFWASESTFQTSIKLFFIPDTDDTISRNEVNTFNTNSAALFSFHSHATYTDS